VRENRSAARPLVIDAESIGRKYRQTFTDKPVREKVELPFSWPARMQHVGDSLAVAYASDKWKKDGDYDLYKHIAESPNRVLVLPGFLHSYDRQERRWPTVGPTVSYARVPMPKHFAVLGLFEEANLRLYTAGTAEAPRFGQKDDGIVKVLVRHGMLGASKIRWSQTPKPRGAVGHWPKLQDQPFIFVYTEPRGSDRGGVVMIIEGDELDVEKDGIVG
jgi:hypothetical protein